MYGIAVICVCRLLGKIWHCAHGYYSLNDAARLLTLVCSAFDLLLFVQYPDAFDIKIARLCIHVTAYNLNGNVQKSLFHRLCDHDADFV